LATFVDVEAVRFTRHTFIELPTEPPSPVLRRVVSDSDLYRHAQESPTVVAGSEMLQACVKNIKTMAAAAHQSASMGHPQTRKKKLAWGGLPTKLKKRLVAAGVTPLFWGEAVVDKDAPQTLARLVRYIEEKAQLRIGAANRGMRQAFVW